MTNIPLVSPISQNNLSFKKADITAKVKENPPPNPQQKQQQRAVRDYCMSIVNENLTGIANPSIAANKFELKLALVNMVQQNHFGGTATEDPNIHQAIFLEVCAILKMNGFFDDATRLRLFPCSLKDRARSLLQSLPPLSITTWDEMTRKFIVTT
ncbi:uncharacterized protein LOC133825006 [Humulus lupulus]|uniref:uncharacterized protein LOC133825006 n=1 Tax=Humulus lupulus TaxID=3486 RepID=UPI002B402B2D|nr:uncharacterized protein LOC133825006 [Humulus lupulus]